MRKLSLVIVLLTCWQAFAGKAPQKPDCAQLLMDERLTRIVLHNMGQVMNFPRQYALASQHIMYQLIVLFDNPHLDFAYFEQLFRRHDLPFFLVANSQPLEEGLGIIYPSELARLKGGTEPLYHLWVGVNGPEEPARLKARLGLSDEENLHRLSQTGFIAADSEEDAAEMESIDMASEETVEDLKKVKMKRPFHPEDN